MRKQIGFMICMERGMIRCWNGERRLRSRLKRVLLV